MSSDVREGVCLRLHESDNVATALAAFPASSTCRVTAGDDMIDVLVIDEIPFGHKVALDAVAEGEWIVKYGQAIGLAIQPIQVGQHVHRHNVRSIRATGKTDGEQA